MHKFIDNIVAFSLKNKFFIFFCTAIAVIAGAVSFKHTPIDAFPDVTNTKVTIITQWPGPPPSVTSSPSPRCRTPLT